MNIKTRLNTLGIRSQLTISLLTVTLIGLIVSGVIIYLQVSSLVSQILEKDLTARVQTIQSAIQINYQEGIDHGKLAIEKIQTRLKTEKLLLTGYYYIINSKGDMILHPTLTGKNVLEKQDLDGQFIFKKIIENKNGIINYRWLNAETKKSQNKLAIFQYLPELDWYISASVNLDEAYEAVYRLRMIIIVTNFTILLILFTCIRWISVSLSSSFRQISSSIMKVALRLKDSSLNVSRSSEDLSSATTQQSAAMTETAASMEEMASTIAHTAQNSRTVLQFSEDSKTEASKSLEVVDKMKIAMQEIQVSNSSLESIVQLINEIQTKTRVINEIVSETRLLSFNASIEAARAGVHGRGFAVVAEEVGKLAQMSGRAAQEIGTLLESGTNQVSDVVRIIRERVTTGHEISTRCEESFTEMGKLLLEIVKSIGEIVTANREQETGVKQANLAISEIDRSTQQNSNNAHSLNQNAKALENESNLLLKDLEHLQSLIFGENNRAS